MVADHGVPNYRRRQWRHHRRVPRADHQRAAGTAAGKRTDQHTRVFYDAAGRATQQIDALGYVTESTYDATGNIVATTAYANAIPVFDEAQRYDDQRGENTSLPTPELTTAVRDGEYSAQAWVRVDDLSLAEPTYHMGIMRSITSETTGDFYLAVGRDGALHFANWRQPGEDLDGRSVTAAGAITEGQWAHVAVVWDGTANHIYVNGVEQTGLTQATTDADWSTGHVVGAHYDYGGGFRFVGEIGDTAYVQGAAWDLATIEAEAAKGAPTWEAQLQQVLDAPSANDQTTRYAYDEAGRRTHSIDPSGYVTKTTYDAMGNIEATTAYATNLNDISAAPQFDAYDGLDTAALTDPLLGSQAFVVSAWINPDSLDPSDATLGSGIVRSTHGDLPGDFFLAVDDDGAVRFGYWDQEGDHVLGDDPNGVLYTADGLIQVGQWQHIVATWDGVKRRIYVDGALAAEQDTVGGTNTTNTQTVWGTANEIGQSYIGAPYGFTGRIDDVRITPYADATPLTQGTVHGALYAEGIPDERPDGIQARLDLLAAANDPNDRILQRSYDAANRVETETDAEGGITATEYDAFGNITKLTDPNGNIGYFYYDDLNRERLAVDPEGYATETQYDAFGNVSETIRYANPFPGGDRYDAVWVDDNTPAGTTRMGTWNFVFTDPAPYSGASAHQSALAAGTHQHYFENATDTLSVAAGDTLFAYVYLDPANPPTEIMLQWKLRGSWNHRAYWGANSIPYGTDGTPSRHYMGALPPAGQWVRLEVPADVVLVEGEVDGMAFALFDGQATWDRAGVMRPIAQADAETLLAALQADPTHDPDKNQHLLYSYDANNRLATETLPIDGYGTATPVVNRNEYDAFGNLTRTTEAEGLAEQRITEYTYDANNRKQTETLPITGYGTTSPVVNRFAYDAFGNLTTQTEAEGLDEERVTQYQYDASNRQTHTIEDQVRLYDNSLVNPTTQQVYDGFGNLIQAIDARNNVTTHYYDHNGRRTAMVDAAGHLHTRRYDAVGNVLETRTYDDALTLPVDPAILPSPAPAATYRSVTYLYNKNNLQTGTTTPEVQLYNLDNATPFYTAAITTQNVYDANGNVVKSIDGRGNATYAYYDAAGNQVLTVDTLGYAVASQYNALGKVTEQTRYANAMTVVGYHENTDPQTLLDALAANTSSEDRTTQYGYDAMGRTTGESVLNLDYATVNATNGALTPQTGTSTKIYDYDGVNNLRQVDENGELTDYTYDGLGRQTQEQLPTFTDFESAAVRTTTTTVYDGLGHVREEIREGKVDADDQITTYDTNALGWVTSQTDPEGATNVVGGATTTYAYDANGNVLKQGDTRTDADYLSTLNSIDISTTYVYDALNRQTQTTDAVGDRHQTDYNAHGEITAKGINEGWQEWYQYDEVGRVWMTNAENGTPRAFLYDENGNATLELHSTTSDIRGLSIAEIFAQNGSAVQVFKNVYDARNLLTDRFEPPIEFTHEAGAVGAVTIVEEQDPFVGGSIALQRGNVHANFWIANNTYYASFQWPDLTAFGDGPISLHYNPSSADNVNIDMTLLAGARSKTVSGGSIRSNGTPYFTLAKAASISQNIVLQWGYTPYVTGLASGGIFENTPDQSNYLGSNIVWWDNNRNAEIPPYTLDWTNPNLIIPGELISYTQNFTGFAPDKIHFKDQSPTATTVRFQYKKTTDANYSGWNYATKYVDGHFIWHNSGQLANGTYDYKYEVYAGAINEANKRNSVEGRWSLATESGSVTSHLNQAPPDVPIPGLQYLINQDPSQTANTIHQSQVYNAFGEVISETGGRGNITDSHYNKLGQLIRTELPETDVTHKNGFIERARPTTEYAYNLNGELVATTDANGHTSSQLLEAGHIAASYNPLGAGGDDYRYAYDIFGNVRRETDEINRVTLKTYDTENRLRTIDRHGDGYDEYEYDEAGNRTAHSHGVPDINGVRDRERHYFDGANRITDHRSFANRLTHYDHVYDASIGGIGGYRVITDLSFGRAAQGLQDYKLRDDTDYFGRVYFHKDQGGRTFDYYYNKAGWLDRQSGSSGQNIEYEYYHNGYLKSVKDWGANAYSKFEYDVNGNRTFEGYAKATEVAANGVLSSYQAYPVTSTTPHEAYQFSEATYDELNRLIRVHDPKHDITYEYDTVGNRRRVNSYYHDGVHGNQQKQDYWYEYDALNRFVRTMGTFSHLDASGEPIRGTSPTDTGRWIDRGTGKIVDYNGANERKQVIDDDGTKDYLYDDNGFLETVKLNGVKSIWRDNSPTGNVDHYYEYDTDGVTVLSHRQYDYDKDGNLEYDRVHVGNADEFDIDYTLKADGMVASTYTGANGGNTDLTTTYYYDYWDTAKQTDIKIQGKNAGINWDTWKPGFSKFTYDVNGHLDLLYDTQVDRTLSYINNHRGQTLQRYDVTATSGDPIIHRYYFFDGRPIGDVGNGESGLVDYAEVLAARRNPDYEAPGPVTSADFDQNYQPIGPNYPARTPGSYTVRTGDTLRGIALQVWGDSGLWYLLADANGLSGDAQLVVGMHLVIPNVVTNIHNNADTFRPFQAGIALGDIFPSNPMPPPPIIERVTRSSEMKHNIDLMKHMQRFGLLSDDAAAEIPEMERTYHEMRHAEKKGKCGGFGAVLIAVVGVVATVFTAGVAAVAMGANAAGLAGVMGAGLSVLGGAAGFGVALAVGAVAGAVGSVVSQVVGNATGITNGFSWKAVAQGALTGGITGGVAGVAGGFTRSLSGTLNITSKLGQAAVGGVVTSGLTQGASVLLGQQKRFSWRSLAASGFAAGVNHALTNKVDPRTGRLESRFNTGNPATHLAQGLATSAIRDGSQVLFKAQDRMQWTSIAGNAIGNTLTAGLAGQFSSPAQRDQLPDSADQDRKQSGVQGVDPSGNPVDSRFQFASTVNVDGLTDEEIKREIASGEAKENRTRDAMLEFFTQDEQSRNLFNSAPLTAEERADLTALQAEQGFFPEVDGQMFVEGSSLHDSLSQLADSLSFEPVLLDAREQMELDFAMNGPDVRNPVRAVQAMEEIHRRQQVEQVRSILDALEIASDVVMPAHSLVRGRVGSATVDALTTGVERSVEGIIGSPTDDMRNREIREFIDTISGPNDGSHQIIELK